MILSEPEQERKINDFLTRKFREFDISDNEPTIHEIRSFGNLRSI